MKTKVKQEVIFNDFNTGIGRVLIDNFPDVDIMAPYAINEVSIEEVAKLSKESGDVLFNLMANELKVDGGTSAGERIGRLLTIMRDATTVANSVRHFYRQLREKHNRRPAKYRITLPISLHHNPHMLATAVVGTITEDYAYGMFQRCMIQQISGNPDNQPFDLLQTVKQNQSADHLEQVGFMHDLDGMYIDGQVLNGKHRGRFQTETLSIYAIKMAACGEEITPAHDEFITKLED